jgi:hypothetical protein
MSGKYGFGGGIELPAPKPRPPVDNTALQDAVAAGARLGFVAREADTRRKPGPKRTELQDKISIPGPKRVIDAFRAHCAAGDLSLWQGLEALLAGQGSGPKP